MISSVVKFRKVFLHFEFLVGSSHFTVRPRSLHECSTSGNAFAFSIAHLRGKQSGPKHFKERIDLFCSHFFRLSGELFFGFFFILFRRDTLLLLLTKSKIYNALLTFRKYVFLCSSAKWFMNTAIYTRWARATLWWKIGPDAFLTQRRRRWDACVCCVGHHS